jgi:hypothetical protein
VREQEDDRRVVALIENLLREDLSPVEEAKAYQAALDGGMTKAQLTKQLALGKERIDNRLPILQLPENVQQLIHQRRIPVAAVPALVKLSVAPNVTRMVATMLDSGQATAATLNDSPASVIHAALRDNWSDGPDEDADRLLPDVWEASRYHGIDDEDLMDLIAALPEGDEAGTKLAEAYEQLPVSDGYDPLAWEARREGLGYDDADVDAARAYGCLLDFGEEGGWFTDPSWLADRLTAKIEKAVKSYHRKAAKRDKAEAAPADADGAGGDPEKEKQAADRAAYEKLQVQARKLNDNLYADLTVATGKVKPTKEIVKMLGALILMATDDWLPFAGVGMIDPAYHEDSKTKAGKPQRKYRQGTATRQECMEAVWRRIDSAKSADEALGAVLYPILAAELASRHASTRSDFRPDKLPNFGYDPKEPRPAIRGVYHDSVQTLAKDLLAPATLAAFKRMRKAG